MACSKNEQRVQVVTHEYNGIDVSHHQGDICWSEVAKDKNIEFVYVKATEGATHLDKRYQTNFEGARKNGLKVGSYHYFRMTSSSHDQFRNFKSKVAKDEQQLIPMVDVETADKKNITETRDSLRVLLTLIEQYYGVKPMIYGTNRSYNEICGKDFLDYKAYIGRYGEKVPAINGPSSCHYYIWQYTENGKINGISKAVDLCRYHSDSNIEGLLYAKGVSKLSKTTEVNNVLVEERYGLNIYYPNFKHVKLVCGKMPSANDKNVLMCCEAAFTGELLSEFKHSNIAGNHVSDGKYHKGYRCKANTGCFAYFADTKTWTFAIGDYNKQLLLAEQRNGCGFGQVMLIHNGKRQPKDAQKRTSKNYYRVLAELKGKLCIIDSKGVMNYNDFVEALLAIGVKHALYLDMGTGWNFSFYRDNSGKVKYIHNKRIKYTTNWITFTK